MSHFVPIAVIVLTVTAFPAGKFPLCEPLLSGDPVVLIPPGVTETIIEILPMFPEQKVYSSAAQCCIGSAIFPS
jgi:hypothetical protein